MAVLKPATTGSVVEAVFAAIFDTEPREVETTGGFFGNSNPLEKFRAAVTERDDQRVERKVKAAVAKLKPDQARALAAEFKQAEAKAWVEVSKASEQEDYHKQRLEKVEALEALLRAQLGLGTLHKYDPTNAVTTLPVRPDLPPIYKYHLWPSYRVKKSSDVWRDYRSIRDSWLTADRLVITVGHRM